MDIIIDSYNHFKVIKHPDGSATIKVYDDRCPDWPDGETPDHVRDIKVPAGEPIRFLNIISESTADEWNERLKRIPENKLMCGDNFCRHTY